MSTITRITPPPPVSETEEWPEAPADAPDAEPGPASTVYLVTRSLWPLFLVLAAVVLIVPFVAGLVVVGVAAALVGIPYGLIRRLR
jgi:hypothetical protein